MIKYYNELRKEEFQWLIKEGVTFGELLKDFPQPPWCNYPGAINGFMGCWSLVGHKVTGEADCQDCEEYKHFNRRE